MESEMEGTSGGETESHVGGDNDNDNTRREEVNHQLTSEEKLDAEITQLKLQLKQQKQKHDAEITQFKLQLEQIQDQPDPLSGRNTSSSHGRRNESEMKGTSGAETEFHVGRDNDKTRGREEVNRHQLTSEEKQTLRAEIKDINLQLKQKRDQLSASSGKNTSSSHGRRNESKIEGTSGGETESHVGGDNDNDKTRGREEVNHQLTSEEKQTLRAEITKLELQLKQKKDQLFASSGRNPSTSHGRRNKGVNAPNPRIEAVQNNLPSNLISYKKKASSSDGRGNDFEIQMAALFFLRFITNALVSDFKIATNMDVAISLDDLVLIYKLVTRDQWGCVFIQLKHKLKNKLKFPALYQPTNDFGLLKYLQSYLGIQKSAPTDNDLKECGNFDNFRFILYTNAGLDDDKFSQYTTTTAFEDETSYETSSNGKIISLFKNEECLNMLKEQIKKYYDRKKQSEEDCEAKKQIEEDWEAKKQIEEDCKAKKQIEEDCEAKKRIEEDCEAKKQIEEDCEAKKQIEEDCEAKKQMEEDCESKKQIRGACEAKKQVQGACEAKKQIEGACEAERISEFLERFHIYANQAKVDDLELLIINEIKKIWEIPESEINLMCSEIIEKFTDWWRNHRYFLTPKCDFWLKIIKKQIEKISQNVVTELKKPKLDFEDSSLDQLRVKIKSIEKRIINVVANGSRTLLSTIKVYSVFHGLDSDSGDKTCILVSFDTLVDKSGEILSAWKSRWCSALVVDCETEPALLNEDIASQLISAVEQNSLVLVLVSTEESILAKYMKQKSTLFSCYEDQTRWDDITDDSQQRLLDREINFQGSAVKLREIIGDSGSVFTEHLKGKSLTELMLPDLEVGKPITEVIEYFIPRTLEFHDGTISSIDSPHDVKEKVVLIVAKPGMGKTTLLTHLADGFKRKHPSTWVIRVDLADHSRYFQELDATSINDETPVDFLEKCCTISGSDLEKELLRHCLLDKNMVLFLDGVDEVCPSYEEKVIPLLNALLKYKAKQMWVTSRSVMETTVEATLRVKSRSLTRFTPENQKDFLIKYWKSKNENLEGKSLETFAQKLLTLTNKSFTDKTNLIIGIPQLAFMLAEIFEEDMKKYCITGRNPVRLDLLYLYDSFMDKKFNNYLTEKKKIDTNLSANIADSALLKERFLENHIQAALFLILRSDQFKDLQMNNTSEFIQKVIDGREKTGIIHKVTDDGKPHFIHRTLAEYLVAKWLAKNFRDHRNLLETNIFLPSFKFIHEIFDRILAINFPLHKAILNLDLDEFKRLLRSGHSVDERDEGGRTALFLAVWCGGPEFEQFSQEIVEHTPNVDASDDVLQWSLILLSSYCGDLTIVKYLTDHNASLDSCDNYGNSSLHLASSKGHLEVVHHLLENGAAMDKRNDFNLTPMECAQRSNRDNVVFSMRTIQDIERCQRPLHEAVKNPNVSIVKYFASKGVDIEMCDDRGNTALCIACKVGNLSAARDLLDLGATLKPGEESYSPLHIAARFGHRSLVELLLDRGASVNAEAYGGVTPLFLAAQSGNYDVTSALLDAGATMKPNAKSVTPLHVSSELGHLRVVRLLLAQRGVDVDAGNADGCSALYLAAGSGHCDVARVLLDARAAMIPDSSGNSLHPLHVSILHGHVSVVRLLLQRGADVEALHNNIRTPLYLAVYVGSLDIVKCLIEHRANPSFRMSDGLTALAFASSKDDEAITDYLIHV